MTPLCPFNNVLRSTCGALLALLLASPLPAATIVTDGVLGNSGEQGESLVRYGFGTAAPLTYGAGVVVDDDGLLWSRAGDGVLNRYSPDGRLVAQYKVAGGVGGWPDNDTLTRVGKLLVLKQHGSLHTLPLDAAPGTAATLVKGVTAGRLSFGSTRDGWLAAANKNEVFMVNPATGETRPVTTRPREVFAVEVGPDGAVYSASDWVTAKFVDGKEVTDGWPKGMPGERPQLLDGFWYGSAWHGTIKRFDTAMQPAPGVVLGGASGSFIGHLDQNNDVENPRGLAKLRDGLLAVSGLGGIVQLLAWQPDKLQFTVIRRIGGVSAAAGLGLDRQGRIWHGGGGWDWTDGPDTPQRRCVPMEIGAQAVMLDNDRMLAPGWQYGNQPRLLYGPLDREIGHTAFGQCKFARRTVGTTVYHGDRGLLHLLAITDQGKALAMLLNGDGSFRENLGDVTLNSAAPVKAWTSLAMKDDTTLLAAADGQILEFTRDGANWKEQRRWQSWGDGAEQRFGPAIWISADAGRLWVADRDRHRVLVFDRKTGELLAGFGTVDKPGTDLISLAAPTTLTARGDRAVVFDSGNQRLVKLRLQ